MKILIYEPDQTGHHFAYLGRMFPGLLRHPEAEVTLATTEAAVRSEEFRRSLASFTEQISIVTSCSPRHTGVFRNALQRASELASHTNDLRPDHCVVMYGDGLWPLVPFLPKLRRALRSCPTEMMLFRGGFTYPGVSTLSSNIKRRILRKLIRQSCFASILPYDDFLADFATKSAQQSRSQTEVRLLPDPVQFRKKVGTPEARRRLGIEHQGPIVSCIGMIDGRKGCDLAIQAMISMERSGKLNDVKLMFAGPHHEQIRSLMSETNLSDRIISIDRFLTDEEMALACEASNLILATYPNHSGRSSIIVWAAAFGVPVLATQRGLIGHIVQREKLGDCIDLNHESLADAIENSLAKPWTEQDIARVFQYAHSQRVETYQNLCVNLIEKRVNGIQISETA